MQHYLTTKTNIERLWWKTKISFALIDQQA